jgi:sulfur carrier protein
MTLRETAAGTAGTAAPIPVRLNGEHRTVPLGSIDALLRSLEIDPRTVVVELNRAIVRRAAFESTYIKEGDEIELVHFVGGG